MDLEQKILFFLQENPDSNARAICKFVGADKTSVNSILYRLKGEKVRKIEGTPPKWSLLNLSSSEKTVAPKISKFGKFEDPIHIDLMGGDWEVTVRISDQSINDPVFKVERLGLRKRVILVSRELIDSQVTTNTQTIPTSVAAIVATAIVWEFLLENPNQFSENFDYAALMKDVILSLSVHK